MFAELIALLKATYTDFNRHNGQWMSAAIAYFTMFAIAPLIIVAVEIASLSLGQNRSVLNEIYDYLQATAGQSAASSVQAIVTATLDQPRTGTIAQIAAWGAFVLGAIGLFTSLQQALNTVWDTEPQKYTIWFTIRMNAIGFLMVVGIALLLMASLGVNSVLTAASDALANVSPVFPTLMKVVDFLVSFAVLTGVFALLFEFLPECRVEWRDVWAGAAITGLLFVIGEFLLGWYLGRAGISSGYGAFGALIVFIVWVNYTAQIILIGAEFTHVYARRHGSRSEQGEGAQRLKASPDEREPMLPHDRRSGVADPKRGVFTR